MNYIVKLEGTEYGPVDELTLAKWVEEDRITADTWIRSEMLENWVKASDIPCLKDVLEDQKQRIAAEGLVDPNEKQESAVAKLIGAIWGRKAVRPFAMGYKPGFASFGNRFSAFCFDGLILLAVFVALCAGGLGYALRQAQATTERAPLARTDDLKIRKELAAPEKKAAAGRPDKAVDPDSNEALLRESVMKAREARDRAIKDLSEKFGEDFARFKKGNFEATTPPTVYADRSAGYRRGYLWVNTADNNRRYICLSADEENALWLESTGLSKVFTAAAMAFLPLLLLYYAISLGYYAQTPGMWFYGIFICRRDEEEVYFFRAFCYTLLMLVFGILTPLFMLLFKRGPHDILSGVYVYSVVAKPSV